MNYHMDNTKKTLLEPIEKRHSSHVPSSRNNGAIMDKMHSQMFFEDLFPQINSLQKKPNNQLLISEIVGLHNCSQRPINYPAETVANKVASAGNQMPQ